MDRTEELLDQLTWHWEEAARPRLDGLGDDEYLWEPVPGCWSLRPRDEARTSMAAGGGDLVLDFEAEPPDPAPVTTIAWRLGHVIVGIFGARNAGHFGGPPMDYQSAVWAPDAASALKQLDEGYARWVDGVRGLGDAGLDRKVGPTEAPWDDRTYGSLVLHITREVVHHLAEVALLRDLYAHGMR